MKKIAIVTITDYLNIGNRLQNLAVQNILEERYNCKIESIQNFGRNQGCEYNCSKGYFTKKKLRLKILIMLGRLFSQFKKYYKFAKFNKHINISKWYFCKDTDYKKLDKSFDYFVVGSDQVWNPAFCLEGFYNNFLMFTDTNKKITFSPSIGVDDIPKENEEEFKNYINTFDSVFLREKTSVELVKKYKSENVFSSIDPTLFISKDCWEKYEAKKEVSKEKYVLTYFLGEIGEIEKYEIYLFAKEKNLKVVNIDNSKRFSTQSMSPDEFLRAVKDAEYIFTDSFHGSVFSFIYRKKFIIYNRKSLVDMNSRIKSLVEVLSIQNLMKSNLKNLNDIDDIEIDYTIGQAEIERQKQNYFNYLDKILGPVRKHE